LDHFSFQVKDQDITGFAGADVHFLVALAEPGLFFLSRGTSPYGNERQ